MMASKEHQKLAKFIKEVHSALRESVNVMGANEAWRKHCENTEVLLEYAQSMEALATKHWEEKCYDETCSATSRITWCSNLAFDYFVKKSYKNHREKEIQIGSKIGLIINTDEYFSDPAKLIDVGSCYNPFKVYDFLNVLPIDLCPANETVLQCDFLEVPVSHELIIDDKKLKQIQVNSFEIVTFCFFLEYIPTSEQRIIACRKAYDILKPGGLLLINTPDSKHVGANCKLMKCWRYTLAHIGFVRIKYEKLKHMHCMAFRKCLHKDIAVRWATIHKESYMECSIHIPQDFPNEKKSETTLNISNCEKEISLADLTELPFFDY